MAAQIEYLIAMLDSLQDLLVITMESLEYLNRNRDRGATSNSQGSRAKSRTPSKPLPSGLIPDFEVTIVAGSQINFIVLQGDTIITVTLFLSMYGNLENWLCLYELIS